MIKFSEVSGPTTLYTAQNYLFVIGRKNTIEIFDVSNRESPTRLGSVPIPNDGYKIELLSVYKKDQFIFASGYMGAYLVDISSFPDVVVSKKLSPTPMKMQPHRDSYFIVASTMRGGIFQFVQNAEMQETSFIDKSVWDFLLCDDTLFCACSEAGFKVFDISRLEMPVLLSQPLGSFLCTSLDAFDKNVIIVKDERGVIFFLDITNPAKPKELAQIKDTLYPYKSYFVSYPFLIARIKNKNEHNIKVFDCSKPTHPELIFTYPAPDIVYTVFNMPFLAGWGLKQNQVEDKNKFELMKINPRGELQIVKSFDETVQIYSAILLADYAYIAKADGLYVMPLTTGRS